MSVYRVQRLSRREAGERPKGYTRSYRFYEEDKPLYQGHCNRWCTKPCEFDAANHSASTGFALEPTRNVMPTTWQVVEGGNRRLIGSLRRKILGRVDWHIRGADGKKLGVFRGRHDPRFWLFRLGDFFFSGDLADVYEILADHKPVAMMERENSITQSSEGPKSGIARVIGAVLPAMDWVIREEGGSEGRIDHRLLLAGVVLLDGISRDLASH